MRSPAYHKSPAAFFFFCQSAFSHACLHLGARGRGPAAAAPGAFPSLSRATCPRRPAAAGARPLRTRPLHGACRTQGWRLQPERPAQSPFTDRQRPSRTAPLEPKKISGVEAHPADATIGVRFKAIGADSDRGCSALDLLNASASKGRAVGPCGTILLVKKGCGCAGLIQAGALRSCLL